MIRLCVNMKTILLLIFFFNSGSVKCQDFQVKYLGIENGLSNNAVTSIFRDHNGFMWFGTYDGLNRYDGYECTVFRNVIGDSNSIHSNNINSINEDAGHNIWVGGQKEISIYNPLTQHFTIPAYTFSNNTTSHQLADNVVKLQLIKGNTMLAGTQHNGLFYFDNSITNGRQVPLIGDIKNSVSYYVTDIKYDVASNTTYVLVQNEGLFVYDVIKRILTLKNSMPRQANCINISGNGDIWIGDNNGLYLCDNLANTISPSVLPNKISVVDICEDKRGTLWIASDGAGIWLLKPGKRKAYPMSATIAENKPLINSNSVYAIYEDKQERKWIGTLRGGVNIIEPQINIFKPVVYHVSNNMAAIDNFILSFCEDDSHNVWIGTDGAGLRYWDRTNNTFKNFSHDSSNSRSISSNFVTGIIKDGNAGLWISTWFGGINRYDFLTHSFKHYACINPVSNTANNNVWTLLHDSRKRLWAAAVRNGGLYLFNEKLNSFTIYDSKLTDLQCLAEDSEGNIWGGDYTSLIKIDTISRKHKLYNIGYAIRSIYEDKKNNFWVGTQEGGLFLFNRQNGTYKRFTTTQGLPQNTILRILEDGDGDLWLSTYNGLSRFDPVKEIFKNFSQADGLQSNQFSFNAALTLSNGELLFGGIKGFNVFYPKTVYEKKAIPQLFLSNLSINNSPVQNNLSYIKDKDANGILKVIVPYNDATLSLNFLGIDYTDASNINYAYYLEGWDKDWNYVKNTRTANFSRLREGDYTFKVKLSYGNGEWSEAVELLHITILPPWYRTWWAYSLYVLLICAVFYVYVLYKSRQTKLHYEVRLAHLETQTEKDLNEKKIAFFTNVSHEFRAPLSLIINPIKDLLKNPVSHAENAELKVVYRNAQRLLRLVDQLLLFKKADSEDSVNLANLNLVSLAKNVFACFTEQARINNISYEMECGLTDLMINGDREKIEIALFNILSNAFKYTPNGGAINFSIQEEASQVKLVISDTGGGISQEEGGKLFERFYQIKNADGKSGFGIGLYLVKKFIEAHQGSVSYESELGKGTSFIIFLNKMNPGFNTGGKGKIAAKKNAGKDLEESGNDTVDYTEERNINLAKQAASNDEPTSSILSELNAAMPEEEIADITQISPVQDELVSDKKALLIIDDDIEILNYLAGIFSTEYKIYKAVSADDGLKLAHEHLPDLIISDIVMKGLNGLELCKILKEDETVSHIPIILLTGTSSEETQLKSMEMGADDYIKKPFDKDLLMARVKSLLKRRNILQNYFFNEVTLGTAKFKVSAEYKGFLNQCIKIIEDHLEDDQFSIKVLAGEIGMSHSNLYRKVKSVSGQTITGFVRFIRLKKAAELLLHTDKNVSETARLTGFNDTKYFRVQFSKLFGLNPSEYIKKFRKPFNNTHTVDDQLRKH
jgi:signal transduction histidine kinase/ligand-binding sensor domain-containing protein/AraC-like DNA-binding protein/ActR/RegA family two-component response regulator